MCVPLAAAALVASIASAGMAAYGAYQQSSVQKAVAKNNANIADAAATSATQRGEEQAQQAQRQARQMTGAQRAGFASRGLDLGAGTPADMLEQTNFFGQSDAATARTNGRQDAWGYKTQGANYIAQANAQNPGMALTGSLLGSAGSVADRWNAWKGAGTGGGKSFGPQLDKFFGGTGGSGD